VSIGNHRQFQRFNETRVDTLKQRLLFQNAWKKAGEIELPPASCCMQAWR
jgi:hypothetical protein